MAKMITLSAYDCVEVDGYLYFFSREYNFLFKLEITTGEISIVDSIPEEKMLERNLCTRVVWHDGSLYFDSMISKKIWKYTLGDGEWKGYELKKIDDFTGKMAFFQMIVYNNKIYLFGRRYPAVVIINPVSEEVQYFEDMYTEKLKKLSKECNDLFFGRDCVQIENYIYMASCLNNTVLKFNMDTCDYEYVIVGNEDNRYSGIGFNGSYFYLSPRGNTDAVMWDGDNYWEPLKIQYLNIRDDNTIGGVYCDEKRVVFYGNCNNDSYILKENNGEIESLSSEGYWFFENVNADTVVSLDGNSDLEITKGKERYEYSLQIEEEAIINYIADKIKKKGLNSEFMLEGDKKGILTETDSFSLRLFTKAL